MDHKRPPHEAITGASHDAQQSASYSSRGSKRPRVDGPPQPLCERCAPLDLDKSFDEALAFYESARQGLTRRRPALYSENDEGPFFYVDAFFVHAFGDRLSTPSGCTLCRFFSSMRVRPDFERHKLLAFCSSEGAVFNLSLLRDSAAWGRIEHTVFMAVVPDDVAYPKDGHDETWLEKEVPRVGAIYRLRGGGGGGRGGRGLSRNGTLPLLRAREVGATVDFALLGEWLGFCRALHGKACSRPESSLCPITRGFRVIDCALQPPEVVAAKWGEPYAALSYVWGPRAEDQVAWPRTVLDAVRVTRELGLRYLWVDRLCIDQSDDDEKEYLISRMTHIYEGSDFTIVAAAGSGASHGLPRVAGDAAVGSKQPKFRLDSGSVLLSAMGDPRLDILNSEHWKRGWTYQEGVLSGRRLVFTQSQVYWECRCMAVHESIELPLELVHEPPAGDAAEGARMAQYMLSGVFKGDSHADGGEGEHKGMSASSDASRLEYGFPSHGQASIRAQLRAMDDHIRAFSSRRLTHDSDSLAAFLGIVGMYRARESLYLYLGLPMWMDDVLGDLTGAYVSFALSVSSWYHRSASEHRLFVSETCRRRPHLPSWTWAGWAGTVTWRAPPSDEHCVIMADLIEAERLHLVWAADLYLRCAGRPVCVRLLNLHSPRVLDAEAPALLEIRLPLVLKHSRLKGTRGTWEWRRLAGRAGAQRYRAERLAWDRQWYRLAGRLASINMSIDITAEQWSAAHESGELVSALVFAAQFPTNTHGRARFLTLRRVEGGAWGGAWERVGSLQLTVPTCDLERCRTSGELLNKLPVKERGGVLVIQ
ncbi:hypothetical protein ESCO_006514 [Escovopsis weberi]|uniref:Heterokaryon incompatibility domain-containing protein n=1 Tax=Escovopsis weberi TaxID=150374 RepID=A0A0M9VS34_ESCWE|nr:hypothetical protein ESCO_006514 [Escovopsis weberi]